MMTRISSVHTRKLVSSGILEMSLLYFYEYGVIYMKKSLRYIDGYTKASFVFLLRHLCFIIFVLSILFQSISAHQIQLVSHTSWDAYRKCFWSYVNSFFKTFEYYGQYFEESIFSLVI